MDRKLTVREAISILENHSIEYRIGTDGTLEACEVWTVGSRLECAWVACPLRRSDLYSWLGY